MSRSSRSTAPTLLALAWLALPGACSRSLPTSSTEVVADAQSSRAASSVTAVASVPSAGATAAPSASAGQASPRPDAGKVACSFDLPASVASVGAVTPAMLLRAIVPSFDPTHGRAQVTRTKDGAVIHDCSGGSAPAAWDEASGPPVPAGTVKLIGRKALPDGRQAVWLATARDYGACALEDGYGFFAIVALDDARLDVLGVATWAPECRNKRALRAEKLHGETVYVEPEEFGTGAGDTHWETVWTLRDGELARAGRYDVRADGGAATQSGEDEAGVYSLPSFEGKPRFEADEIVVTGQNKWSNATGVVRTERVVRRYALQGDWLVDRSGSAIKFATRGRLVCRAPGDDQLVELYLDWRHGSAVGTLETFVVSTSARTSRSVHAEPSKSLVLVSPAETPLGKDPIATLRAEGNKSIKVGASGAWLACEH
jgi:hypothetical protein